MAMPTPLCTLLVELPFKSVERPNLGLSLLKAVLEEAGFPCAVRYANLSFAASIGLELYQAISGEMAQECLAGDLVFAPLVRGAAVTADPANLRPLSLPAWF